MLQQFEHFSSVSGLKANLEKSSLYVAGISQELKESTINAHRNALYYGNLPFKYLGVPLSSKKLSISQCYSADRMTARIRCWTSKLLSYSGRLQLIESVLFEKHTGHMSSYCLRRSIPWWLVFAGVFCGPTVMNPQEELSLHGKHFVSQDLLEAIIFWISHYGTGKQYVSSCGPLLRRIGYGSYGNILTISREGSSLWQLLLTKQVDDTWLVKLDSFVQNSKFSIKKTYVYFLPQYPKVPGKK